VGWLTGLRKIGAEESRNKTAAANEKRIFSDFPTFCFPTLRQKMCNLDVLNPKEKERAGDREWSR
jgi:hypothetical protein